MEFVCDRCHARFLTSEEPAPAHTYRMRCACGNAMVVRAGRGEGELPTLAGADLEPVAPADDPFLAAQARAPERLALRDPDAPPELTAEDRITSGFAIDALVRRARLRGFLGGAAVGALGVALIVAALALFAAEPASTVVVVPRAPAATASAPPPEAGPQEDAGGRRALRAPARRAAPAKPPAAAARSPPPLPVAPAPPPEPELAAPTDGPPAAADGKDGPAAAPVPRSEPEPEPEPGPAPRPEASPGSGEGR